MKKRVLIDLTSLDDNFSGIEHYALYITKELIKNPDFDFELIFKNKVSHFEPDELKHLKTTILAGDRYEVLLKKIPNYIDKAKPDYTLFMAFPPSFLWKPKKGTKVISVIHDLVAFDVPKTMSFKSCVYYRKSIKHQVRISTHLVANSKFTASRVIDKFHVSPDKITIAYCASSMPSIEKSKEEIQKKYFLPNHYLLGLSTLEPRKNFGTLISWMTKVWMDDSTIPDLALVGRKGWKIGKILEGVPETLKSKIHFTGFVDEEDIFSVYKYADTFIFPSIYEGFGIPILEAAQTGQLPLCSKIPTSVEIMGKDYPFFFELDDFDGFVKNLFAILKNDSDKEKLAGEVQKEAQKFNWRDSSKKVLMLLE